jgi:prevent-host-death family protein
VSDGEVARVGLRDLRHHTREIVDRARRGQVVSITDRGQEIARLLPPVDEAPPEALGRLMAAGLVRPAPRPGYRPARRPATDGLTTAEVLDDLRGE